MCLARTTLGLPFCLRPLPYDISSGGNLLASSATGPVPSSAEGGGALLWIPLGTKEQIMLIHLGPPCVLTCKHKFKVNILTVALSLHQEKSNFFIFFIFNLQESCSSCFPCKILCCRLEPSTELLRSWPWWQSACVMAGGTG